MFKLVPAGQRRQRKTQLLLYKHAWKRVPSTPRRYICEPKCAYVNKRLTAYAASVVTRWLFANNVSTHASVMNSFLTSRSLAQTKPENAEIHSRSWSFFLFLCFSLQVDHVVLVFFFNILYVWELILVIIRWFDWGSKVC